MSMLEDRTAPLREGFPSEVVESTTDGRVDLGGLRSS